MEQAIGQNMDLWRYWYLHYCTVQVPITTGTVTESSSVYTGLLGALSRYIYRTGKM